MKIERHLPQFDNESALILACGAHVSKVYVAKNGTLNDARIIEAPIPHYSDREGLFGNRASGGTLVARGAPIEHPKESVIKDFLKRLETVLTRDFPRETFTSLYLFAPPYMKHAIIGAVPPRLQATPCIYFEGNYVKRHPFVLLEEIQKLDEMHSETAFPPTDEAVKILKKSSRTIHSS